VSEAHRLVSVALRVIPATHALVEEMRPPLGPPGRPQCALFLSIAEQFEAAILLAQSGLTTHAGVHVRSMLESLADVYQLAAKSDHVRRMQYEQAHGEKKLYDRMLATDLLQPHDRSMLEARLADCMTRYQPLHQEFRRGKPSQADHFIAAGLPELIGPYTILCSFTHSDLTALALRHQGERGMILRAPVAYDVLFLILSLATYSLVHAARALEAVVYLPEGSYDLHLARLESLQDELMVLRPKLPEAEQTNESRPEAAAAQ
jgi:hypothetical protein